MLGIAHTLMTQGKHDKVFLEKYTTGYPQFEEYLTGKSFIYIIQLVAQIDFKANTILGGVTDVAYRSLLVKFLLNQRHGGLDNVVHKTFHKRALRQIRDIA